MEEILLGMVKSLISRKKSGGLNILGAFFYSLTKKTVDFALLTN
jgi:hypothetical protein